MKFFSKIVKKYLSDIEIKSKPEELVSSFSDQFESDDDYKKLCASIIEVRKEISDLYIKTKKKNFPKINIYNENRFKSNDFFNDPNNWLGVSVTTIYELLIIILFSNDSLNHKKVHHQIRIMFNNLKSKMKSSLQKYTGTKYDEVKVELFELIYNPIKRVTEIFEKISKNDKKILLLLKMVIFFIFIASISLYLSANIGESLFKEDQNE